MRGKHASLADLIDAYQASGRYSLTRKHALGALAVSDEGLKKAVRRLVAKRRLSVPRRGFYVIVPVEYREAGAPPPAWFVDELMKFHGQPYYVGILSAAALHGAAHQQPQEFQVVTNEQLRPAVAGRSRIRFFTKRHVERAPTMAIQTETGTMRVSTPEATALDLFKYLKAAGHLGNVATVLAELAERLEGARLAGVARKDGDLSNAQRLGFLLEHVGAGETAAALGEWVAAERPRFVALRPGHASRRAPRDGRWRVLVNESIEAEA
jgi:predicted transcriptional regulator of viral defense system